MFRRFRRQIFGIVLLLLVAPMFLFVMYVQFVAVMIVLRPRLHVLWGYLLIVFHVGTWLLLDIIFVQQVLILALLFVLSPFRVTAPEGSVLNAPYPVEMAREIPILGLVLERVVPRSVRGGRHERPAYPDHL